MYKGNYENPRRYPPEEPLKKDIPGSRPGLAGFIKPNDYTFM